MAVNDDAENCGDQPKVDCSNPTNPPEHTPPPPPVLLANPDPELLMVGSYTLIKTLGKGSSGVVKLGEHFQTHERRAIKIIPKAAVLASSKKMRRLEAEIHTLQAIHHPHITRLYQFTASQDHYALVMEYVAGKNLFQILKRGSSCHGLSTERAFLYFYQLVSALECCHSSGIAHRDIKLENILVNESTNIVKLTDFGLATVVLEKQLAETACGSPHYAAPEIVRGEKYNGKISDIWSLGVVLYTMCAGKLPFIQESVPLLLKMISRGTYTMPPEFNSELADLVQQMLHLSCAKRVTARQIKRHPWWLHNCAALHLDPNGIPTLTTVLTTPRISSNLFPTTSSSESSSSSFSYGPSEKSGGLRSLSTITPAPVPFISFTNLLRSVLQATPSSPSQASPGAPPVSPQSLKYTNAAAVRTLAQPPFAMPNHHRQAPVLVQPPENVGATFEPIATGTRPPGRVRALFMKLKFALRRKSSGASSVGLSSDSSQAIS